MKNPKLVIGIILIVVLLIIFFAVLANSKKTVVNTKGEVVTQQGFLDTILGIFNPKGTSTSTSSNNISSQFCKIFPKLCGGHKKYCDCANAGYTIDGDLSPLCTEGIGDSWIKDCK